MGFHDIPVARRGIANPLAAMALIGFTSLSGKRATIHARHDAGWGNTIGYDWDGARGRRMKIARIGTAVALAALLVFVATEVVTRSL